ncbi:MAG: valine--tRNA ligase [Omnitrophica bacterium RIFCSPLOWO2_01_FULL_50_24]|nr:MAG: valine--tRNA ligase [Omnitrophica bacterium RIFCSPLOWO2_01_FULL_50_24]
MESLPNRYHPNEIETKWYTVWEKAGFFLPRHPQTGKPIVCDSASKLPSQKPYTIVIPPPNVTGVLHMGHALNNTLQDILIRWRRMQGVPTLWLPGVDHAGIATQNVVEKKLAKANQTRHALGREKFVEEVWKWKEEHGSTIVKQLRMLGASCDWSRERFTMDEGLSRAVRETFVLLYERGLIYRGDYIINWCPRCQTALSDEEAVHQEIEGALYQIKYPVEGTGGFISLATTRPETMLGDTAVAIHPKDKRYQHLRGKKVILPLVKRVIPVIEDEFVDPEFGTGIVKVTPAHDPNDFELGIRHGLERINVLNPDGSINEKGGPYQGLDRLSARKKVVEDLKAQGLFEGEKRHLHAVGHCYRCHTIVEPYLSKQWFVKMKPLAQKALKAQSEGKVVFLPSRWTKVYTGWLENIRDWCISRQIWWGHQIPVWYCVGDETCLLECKQPIVSREDPKKCPACGSTRLRQDPDVLDTWFSSWLWPFSTLGWPRQTSDLRYFYPTSTLITAQEIIFFWVARMIMAGLELVGQVPFHTVFIHGTVRVEGGKKMSKSLGNVIDPLEMIDEIGADALRFSLVMLAATDAFLSREKFELGRNFTNKIWNASRFVFTHLEKDRPKLTSGFWDHEEKLSTIDKWMLAELDQAILETTECLEACRFFDAANIVYHFFWHSLCDWYLELVKPVLMQDAPSERKQAVLSVLTFVLERSLRLIHPFMPFLTEEVWHLLKERVQGDEVSGETLMYAPWPSAQTKGKFKREQEKVNLFQEAVTGIRDLRARLGLKPAERVGDVYMTAKSENVQKAVSEFREEICFFARVDRLTVREKLKKEVGMVGRVYHDLEIFVGGLSEDGLKKEAERTENKISELEQLVCSIDRRLQNEDFRAKAPDEVVSAERERKKNFEEQLASHRENLQLFR